MITRGALLLAVALLMAATGCQTSRTPPAALSGRPPFRIQGETTRSVNDTTLHTFENGLTLIHREQTANALAGIAVYIRSGASEDPDDLAGLSNLLLQVLPKGTQTRNADRIAEELAMLGTNISSNAGQDYYHFVMPCVATDLDPALELLADILFHPAFPSDEIELERSKILAAIRMRDDRPPSFAIRRFREELFGVHPYGRPVEGLPGTIPGILPSDLYARHQADFVPSAMVVSIVGNVSFDKARNLVSRHFGMVLPARELRYSANKLIAPSAGRTEITRDSEQAFVVMGHLTCATGDRDEPALQVASTILGGGMSSRLFAELRDRRGMAYALGASAAFLDQQGYFFVYIGTSPSNLAPAPDSPGASIVESGLWQEIERLRMSPVSEEELERAKNYIAGNFLTAQERNAHVASMLAYWHLSDKGLDYADRFLRDIRAVTSRDVMRVANKYFLDPTVVVLRPRAMPVSAPE